MDCCNNSELMEILDLIDNKYPKELFQLICKFTLRSKWIKIATKYNHSLALGDDGSIFSWGSNCYETLSKSPEGSPEGFGFKDIAVGHDCQAAIKDDGTIFCWGNNVTRFSYNHGSEISNTPKGTGFKMIGIGEDCLTTIKNDGSLYSWSNIGPEHHWYEEPMYDNDNPNEQISETPKDFEFKSISIGSQFSIALKNNGSIVYWGEDLGIIISDNFGFKAISVGTKLEANGTAGLRPFTSGDIIATALQASSGTDIIAVDIQREGAT